MQKVVGNVRNWITIGGVSLQTTEFIKFLYVFIAAGLLGTKANPDKENIRAFYTVTFLEVLFLALQSEFGTMLLILVKGAEKKKLTVENLLHKFEEASGEEFANDRMLLG